MKRGFIVLMVALSMVILLSPWSGPVPQAASRGGACRGLKNLNPAAS